MTKTRTAHNPFPAFNREFLWLAPALLLYAALCWKLLFIQDDAFISYRYVLNALSGHGLVYNIGEKIEGFTNFGWVTLLLLAGRLGLNIIPVSMFLGALCGAGVILVTALTARVVLRTQSAWYAWMAVYLLAMNGALAYWSPAGLETACFALMAALSLYFYVTGNWMLIASLLLAVWMRPDGAVIAVLLMVIEAIERRGLPQFSGRATLAALVLSLPWVVFKLVYYGSVLPNPFYAKTSFDITQVKHGLQYTGEFLLQYGFLGFGLIVPLIFWRRLDRPQRAVWLFLVGFMAYVTLIGGDVLKVHRFYLPVLGLSAILVALSLWLILRATASHVQRLAVSITTVSLMAVSWFVPLNTINSFLQMERGFVGVMRLAGQKLKAQDQSDFTVATSTIGALGYTLMGHRVIDLVGLVDSTVARHRQTDLAGIESTWKEQSFNATYVLREAPEYIVFATGAKPSSPAEQALFLYDSFLKSYRVSTVAYLPQPRSPQLRPYEVYRKIRQPEEPIRPNYAVPFVTALKRGFELQNDGSHQEALRMFAFAEKYLDGAIYPELSYREASSLMQTQHYEQAYDMMNQILSRDSLVSGPQRDLYMTEMLNGNVAKAAVHRHYLQILSPGDVPVADSTVRAILQDGKR